VSAFTVTGIVSVAGVTFDADTLSIIEPDPRVLGVPDIVNVVAFDVTRIPSGAVYMLEISDAPLSRYAGIVIEKETEVIFCPT
jgi:hypothetical protein